MCLKVWVGFKLNLVFFFINFVFIFCISQVALKSHIRHVHTDKKAFVCQYCGRAMKCKNSLYGHIRQYHQSTITLYECDLCQRQFRQKVGSLRGNVRGTEMSWPSMTQILLGGHPGMHGGVFGFLSIIVRQSHNPQGCIRQANFWVYIVSPIFLPLWFSQTLLLKGWSLSQQ